jgi:hypothetical protein
MDFSSLRNWFMMNSEQLNTDSQGAYWTLKRGDRTLIHSNFTIADPEQSWNALQGMMEGEMNYGGREFRVIFKKSPRDAENKCPSRIVTIPFSSSTNQNNTSVAIGSLQQDLLRETFNARLNAFEEQSRTREENLRKEFEWKNQIRELQEENAALHHSKRTNVDRFFEVLEERPKILNQILGIFDRRMPAIQVSGPEQLQEVPAHGHTDEYEEAREEGNVEIDFNMPIQAYVNLRNAGITDEASIVRLCDSAIVLKSIGYDDPITIIEKVVAYCQNNQAASKIFINGL